MGIRYKTIRNPVCRNILLLVTSPTTSTASKAGAAMAREIHALNKEMMAAGVRKFACGLGSAKLLRAQTKRRSPHHRWAIP